MTSQMNLIMVLCCDTVIKGEAGALYYFPHVVTLIQNYVNHLWSIIMVESHSTVCMSSFLIFSALSSAVSS